MVSPGVRLWRARIRIFELTLEESPSQEFLSSIASPILQARDACKGCVDEALTLAWARRLYDNRPAIAMRAHQALRDLLALAPVSTAKVERKHLLGQETRAQQHRGRALQGRTLAKATYAKSVALVCCRLRQQVVDKVMRPEGHPAATCQRDGILPFGRGRPPDRSRQGRWAPCRGFCKEGGQSSGL